LWKEQQKMPGRVLGEFSVRPSLLATAFVFLWVVLGAHGELAYSAAPFYEGKAIRIIVGTAPGGGYDT
jgi:tripartite-type tricarboxylate transporter receptor subunit TctC